VKTSVRKLASVLLAILGAGGLVESSLTLKADVGPLYQFPSEINVNGDGRLYASKAIWLFNPTRETLEVFTKPTCGHAARFNGVLQTR
jgi:hypothetical protein